MPDAAPPVHVRRIEYIDLPFVVEQHQRFFPGGFLTRLGGNFLKHYYLTYCTSDDAVAVVAMSAGTRAGYLVGTTNPTAYRRHALKWHRTTLLRHGLLALLRRPRLLTHFIRTRALLYARKILVQGHSPGARPDRDKVAVMHHLVVLPEFQGRGIGTRLIAGLEDAAAAAGCTSLVLVTETGGQGAAYYAAHGWRSCGEHRTRDGLRVTTYTLDIAPRDLPRAPQRKMGT